MSVVSVLGVILVFGSIAGYALAWSKLLRLPFALTLVSACCAIGCVSYIGALIGVLRGTQAALLIGGAAVLLIWIIYTPGKEIRRQLFSPAVIVVVIGATILFAVTRGIPLIVWDEFSEWGAITRELLLTNQLPTQRESLMFLSYPPGDALFQYFVTRPLGYSEGNMILGHAFFQLAAIVTILASLRWRDAALGLALLALACAGGYIFAVANVNWTTLLVDIEVGFVFASTLAIYLLAGGGIRAMLCAAPVVADMAIIKEVGFLYAIMFALMVLVDKTVVALWNGVSIRQMRWSAAGAYSLLVLGPLLMKSSWDAHVHAINAVHIFDISWSTIRVRVVESDFAQTFLTVMGKLNEALHGGVPVGAVPFALPGWFAILTVLALAAILTQKDNENRVRILVFQLLLAAFFAILFVLLACYYVIAFWSYEAVRLASFDRYIGNFILSWLFMSLVMIIHDIRRTRLRWIVTAFVAGLAGGTIYLTRTPVLTALTAGPRGDAFSQQMIKLRRSVKDRLGNFAAEIPVDSRVFIIWNNTTGLPYYISSFELRPRQVDFDIGPRRMGVSCFSLGPKRFEGDIWTCDWTPEFLRSQLQNYDYVFLGYADDVFWNHYSSLFAPGSRQASTAFFRIDHSSPQGLLYPVAPINPKTE